MTDEYRFPHEYLDVYRLALELSKKACALADTIVRGRRKLADQFVRAGSSTPLLIAEDTESKGPRREISGALGCQGGVVEITAGILFVGRG